ncbi:MAG: hypothetical protein ACTHOA_13585 [Rhodanobacter sp.]|jgi:hypothetical protein
MLRFIPFEDDWDAFERMRPEDFIPYRVGLLPEPALATPPTCAVALSQETCPARPLFSRGAKES